MDSSASRPDVIVATIMRPAGITGVQTHTRSLVDGFRERGLACEVASAFTAGWWWLPLFALRPLLLHRLDKDWSTRWYRHWHRLAVRSALGRSLRRTPEAVVIAQDPLSAAAALGVRGRLRTGTKIVLVCHFNISQADEFRVKGELRGEEAYRRIQELEAQVLTEVDIVVYVSEWSRKTIEESRGLIPRASMVIPNGIPDIHPAVSPVARAELGLGPDDVVLVTIGSLEPRKNQLGLLDAFSRVVAAQPRARLVLVGDGPERAAVRDRIEKLRLVDEVRMVGARNDIAAILASCDVYVHLAHVENMPIAILEAARAGLPVAAAPVGGIPELLGPICGVALDAHDPGRSAQALERLVAGSSADRRRAGQSAREGFQRSFTADAMVARYIGLVRSLADPRAQTTN